MILPGIDVGGSAIKAGLADVTRGELTTELHEYLEVMHRLFWPDVFILGGAVSESFGQFSPLLRSPAEIRPARFTAQAGVIGAALAAAASLHKP